MPAPVFTSLKITGLSVFSAGVLAAEDAEDQEVTLHDARRGIYKKIVLREGELLEAFFTAMSRMGPDMSS